MNWPRSAHSRIASGASRRERRIAGIPSGSEAEHLGSGFISLGLSVLGLAPAVLGLSIFAIPLAAARPRGASRRQLRRARARLDVVAGALGAAVPLPSDPLPADLVVDSVARRGRLVARTLVLSLPPFAIMSVGFLLTCWGILLRDSARSDSVPMIACVRVLVVALAYLLFLAAVVAIQRVVWNRYPRYFAAHSLLRTLEILLSLTADGAGVDVDKVREDGIATLGQSARYLRRLVGRRVPNMARAELVDVRQRAAELSAAVTSHQRVLTYGSREEIVAVVPMVARTLAALVEHRWPGPGPGPEPGPGPVENGNGAGGRDWNGDDVDRLQHELATIYTTAGSADPLLSPLGYGPERRPNIDHHSPAVAWHQIFHEFRQGAVVDPWPRLLAGALAARPANAVLVELARDHCVPLPPPGNTSRRLPVKPSWPRPFR